MDVVIVYVTRKFLSDLLVGSFFLLLDVFYDEMTLL
jgi:hypothetical protein